MAVAQQQTHDTSRKQHSMPVVDGPIRKQSRVLEPKRLGPVCYNPQAARTVLPILLIRTKLALAGKSKAEMNEGMEQRWMRNHARVARG